MTPALDNIFKLAERDMAAGRYADAEREYALLLESDADMYLALHSRGIARTWQSNLLSGDPIALIDSTDEALKLCRKVGGDEAAFLSRISFEIINLTANKYNELTRIYNSIVRRENQKAPSPLFFYTWDYAHPNGLALDDVYIPLINYLAAIIMDSEFLDRLLADREDLKVRRLHNITNLAIFYDWLISFNASGKVNEDYYKDILRKKEAVAAVRETLETELSAPDFQNIPRDFPEGKPLPGLAKTVEEDKKIAHFPVRPPFEVVCPVCGTVQKSNRSICYECSCKFVFDDDLD